MIMGINGGDWVKFAEGITGAAVQKAAQLGSKLREAAWTPPCLL